MTGFIIGAFLLGGFLGALAMALCVIGRTRDDPAPDDTSEQVGRVFPRVWRGDE